MDTQQLVRKLALELEVHSSPPEQQMWSRLAIWTSLASLFTLAAILLLLSRSPHLAHGPGATILVTVLAGAALAGTAFGAVLQLSYPEGRLNAWWLLLPLVILAGGVSLELAHTPRYSWSSRFWGGNPLACFLCVTALSLPILAAILMALRHGATSSPRPAGAAAGLLAGGITVALYTVHCPENSLLFIASWHGLAVLTVALLGAVAADRCLRW